VSVYDAWGQQAYDSTEIASNAPSIDSLAVMYGTGTEVTITGQVTDEAPGGLTVDFYGSVYGTAVTDASGSFSLHVPDGSASLGDVTVSVSDAWGQGTYDYVMITGNDVPEIANFTTHIDDDGLLTVEGTVTDEDPIGLTVVINFWGSQYEVTTDSSGNFSWQWQLEEGQDGWLTAIASDWWTLESNTAEAYVSYG